MVIALGSGTINAMSLTVWRGNFKQISRLDEENARKQAILGLMMNRPAHQPTPLMFTPLQVPKTTATNCMWVGAQLNCTSR
jgi:hypothetical protein